MVVGVGFAGLGWLGQSLLADLERFPELRLAAVQDIVGELATEVQGRFAAPWAGDDYEAMLRRPSVDAVVICTPNAQHAQQALAALAAGKHVLVQKPLATSAAAARQTVELAREVPRVLLVDCSYRFLETTAVLRETVAALGRIRAIRGVFHNVYGPGKSWFFDPAQSGGGALTDLGVHLIDLALDVTRPANVHLVDAELGYGRGLAVEDAATIDVSLDGIPLHVAVSWESSHPLTQIALEVECAGGLAAWRNVEGSFFRFQTWRGETLLLDRETTLREDTLRAFTCALRARRAEPPDVRTYELLEQVYAGAAVLSQRAQP